MPDKVTKTCSNCQTKYTVTWDSEEGDLESIANKVINENIEPEPQSGQQEYLENILNKYL